MNIKDIFKLVEKYPNDMELGEQIRAIYWEQKKLNLPDNTDNEKTIQWTENTTVEDDGLTIHWDELDAEHNVMT